MINYLVGDAIESLEVSKPKIIFHIVNNVGQFSAGFVRPLAAKWPKVRQEYWDWKDGQVDTPFELGYIQLVRVEKQVLVCNAIAQDNKNWVTGEPACKLNHLETCFKKVAAFIEDKQPFFDKPISIVLPKVGCGIGGLPGFHVVEPLLIDIFCSKNIPVFVYTLP